MKTLKSLPPIVLSPAVNTHQEDMRDQGTKIRVDAASFVAKGTSGLEAMAQDNSGILLRPARRIMKFVDPLQVEVEAIILSLKLAKTWYY